MKMIVSCFFFAIAGACVYESRLLHDDLIPLVASAVRIAVNLVVLLSVGMWRRDVKSLWGDGRPSLWWRGVFGTTALILSFASIAAIGVGESAFLQASSSIFVALFAPLILKVPNPPRIWVALGAGLVGVGLLFHPRMADLHPWGRIFGISCGLFSALAYLMIARAGRSNTPESVIFYFCLVGVIVHALLFCFVPATWPRDFMTWVVLLAAGASASVGQHFLTRAYQEMPAAENAILSYTGPLMSTAIGIFIFGNRLDASSWCGAVLILFCGVFIPWVKFIKSEKPQNA